MASHHEVLVREYVEYQCEDAGVGFKFVIDREKL